MPDSHQLIAQLVEETLRARVRRLHMASQNTCTLQALRVVDGRIDRNLQALALFGRVSLQAVAAHESGDDPRWRAAAVHLGCALWLQSGMATGTQDGQQAWWHWLSQRAELHLHALEEAIWFFPVNLNPFDRQTQHLLPLLAHPDMALQRVAATLIGLLGLREGTAAVAQWMRGHPNDLDLQRTGALALQRLATGQRSTDAALLQSCGKLLRTSAADAHHAIDVLLAAGQAAHMPPGALLEAAHQYPGIAHAALVALAFSNPTQASQAVLNNAPCHADTRALVLALCGDPAGLLSLLADVLGRDTPARPAERDALALLMGNLPVSFDQLPLDAAARERDMQQAVLKLFRQAFVGVVNQAGEAGWSAEAWLPPEHLGTAVRLRFGQRLEHAPVLPDAVLTMGQSARQALYDEQSSRNGLAFGFGLRSAAHARHQTDQIGLAQQFFSLVGHEGHG